MTHVLSSSPCRVRRAVGLGSHPNNRLLRTLSHQTQCKCHHHLCLICNFLCTLHPTAHRKLNSQHRYQIALLNTLTFLCTFWSLWYSDHKLIISQFLSYFYCCSNRCSVLLCWWNAVPYSLCKYSRAVDFIPTLLTTHEPLTRPAYYCRPTAL